MSVGEVGSLTSCPACLPEDPVLRAASPSLHVKLAHT